MADLIRSGSLTHYAEVARSVGLDPRDMLRQARLPLRCLDQPDLRIPVSGVRRLLTASAIASGVEDFSLRLAARGDLSPLGPIAFAIREQTTLGAVIEALSRYIHIQDEAMRLEIEYRDDLVMIVMFLRGGPQRATRQSTELALARIHRAIHLLFGDSWQPLEVHFIHSPPHWRGPYRQFFGCNVRFDSDFDAILCRASDMNLPMPKPDPLIASYLQSRAQEIDVRSQGWDDKVRELVRSLLSGGNCSIEHVAQHLGCDRRTIHRHLAESSTTFSAILDAERADIATRLIEDGNRPLKEITGLLGFSAQSALARWFRGKFHCSIREWRGDGRRRSVTALSRWRSTTFGRTST
jgi:AraC-like DNA-binding protein